MDNLKEKIMEIFKDQWPNIEKQQELFKHVVDIHTAQDGLKFENDLLKLKDPVMQEKIKKLLTFRVKCNSDFIIQALHHRRKSIRTIFEKYCSAEIQYEWRSFLGFNWSVEWYNMIPYFCPKEAFTLQQIEFMKKDIYMQVTFPEKQELISIN